MDRFRVADAFAAARQKREQRKEDEWKSEVLHDIAMNISGRDPTYNKPYGSEAICQYCGMTWSFDQREQSLLMEGHDPSCIWRTAREYASYHASLHTAKEAPCPTPSPPSPSK